MVKYYCYKYSTTTISLSIAGTQQHKKGARLTWKGRQKPGQEEPHMKELQLDLVVSGECVLKGFYQRINIQNITTDTNIWEVIGRQ